MSNAEQDTPMPMPTNAGRSIVVTGAGSGIGRATVHRLAAEGAHVVAVDLHADSLEWCADLEAVTTFAGDVTDPNVNQQMVAIAVERHGGLHAVALNAGILVQGDIARGTLEDFDKVMDVNVRGVVLGMKAALPELAKNDADAAMVVTGSVSGLRGDSGLFAYNASKGAVVNLARAVALDVAHLGVRVNAVCPGPTESAMTAPAEGQAIGDAMKARVPLGRFGRADELAAVISFLASPASSYMTGAAVPVDGGVTAGTGQWATYGGRQAGIQ